MKGVAAHINPTLLVWARNTVKLPIGVAAQKIGVKPERLENWELGVEKPTITQLGKIASVYRRPFALFYLPEPPKHFKAIKDFRKFPEDYIVSEIEEYNLQSEILRIHRKRQIAIDLYELQNTTLPTFTLKAKLHDDVGAVSTKILNYLNVSRAEQRDMKPGYEALNFWKRKIESKGVLIFQSTGVDLKLMRGACISEEILPVIMVNSNDSPNGRIFSLLHELAHIVYRENGISNYTGDPQLEQDKVEVVCNQVAADVLVPAHFFLHSEIVQSHPRSLKEWNDSEIQALANLFCVSQEVIVRRLLTFNLTSNHFYKTFRDGRQFFKKKEKSGTGDVYRNVIAKNGRHFLNLVLDGYHSNQITASAMSDYISVKASNLGKLESKFHG